MREKKFSNPIIKGGYPDPSICRVGEWYYLVTSSFSYFPGLPVFRSRDMVHWEQICNAISRSEQLDYRNCDISEGLWAATIRHHKDRFYIINTLDVNGRTSRFNYIITADDPAGPWSDAIIIEGADGIDPSLYFDDEGRIWYCSNTIPNELIFPEQKQIYLCEIDPLTFQFSGERKIIFDAAVDHNYYMEAPHIYHIGDIYYLMTASGGTQTNHCVNIYRSHDLFGPYEPCPRNPIVTNRNLPIVNRVGVSVAGHGDLVVTQKREWYMVLLGIRPYEAEVEDYDKFLPRMWIRTPDRNRKAQFNLGREVFLIPIAWDYDGWPIVDNSNGMVNLQERFPNLPEYHFPLQTRVDNFEESMLDMCWCMRRPVDEVFYSLNQRFGFLRMHLLPVKIEDLGTPAMLVRRQQHNDFQISTALEFTANCQGEEAGIAILQNERFGYVLVKNWTEKGAAVSCYKIENGCRELLADVLVEAERIYLTVEGDVGKYSFYYGTSEKQLIPVIERTDGLLLSSLVADGYVGTYLGMYASSCGEFTENYADFDWFRYEIIEQ